MLRFKATSSNISVNDITFPKNTIAIEIAQERVRVLYSATGQVMVDWTPWNETSLDGVVANSIESITEWADTNMYSAGGTTPSGSIMWEDIQGIPPLVERDENGNITSIAKPTVIVDEEVHTLAYVSDIVDKIPNGGTNGQVLKKNAQGQNIWAADANTTYVASDSAPAALGTAAAGTSAQYSRADHVHPVPGSVAKLTTGRTITLTGGATGVSAAFDGSANLSFAVTLATPTTTVRGGVLQQANIEDVGEVAVEPTHINAILTALRAAGIIG